MTYWNKNKNVHNDCNIPSGDVLVVGAGFAGLSAALELSKHCSVSVVYVGDNSYSRNAGHVIPTMGESLHASIAIRGKSKAMALQAHAFKCVDEIVQWCDKTPDTLLDQGYYVIPSNIYERDSLTSSQAIYNDETSRECVIKKTPNFKSELALYMGSGYFGDPVMFRDSLAKACKANNVSINKYAAVVDVKSSINGVTVVYEDGTKTEHSAVVLCNNAYPLGLQKAYTDRFIGQIAVSHPITTKRLTPMAFSADHGYIYGQITCDNRLLIGGWRNNVKDHDGISPNNYKITKGLQAFVDEKFDIKVDIVNAEYIWRGAMAQTTDGLPIVGEIDMGIYTCTGWNGYGFSQAHYTATCLAKMIMDEPLDADSKQTIIEHFNPRRFI